MIKKCSRRRIFILPRSLVRALVLGSIFGFAALSNLTGLSVTQAAPKSGETPGEIAAQLDRLFQKENAAEKNEEKNESKTESSSSTSQANLCDDATFLRRVSLDIVGDLPTPEKLTSFALDPSENKREELIDALLRDPQYGQNWARYWRDVILYRRMEDRALLVANPLVVYLTEELNQGTSWAKVASGFITAKGDIREDGRTAIIVAQDGKTAETTAEVARIFLGMQIQCSQCHDDFSGRWKREEFHELAAFFPRVAVRPVRSATKRTLEVAANDNENRRRRRPNNNRYRGSPEHYMPNLEDPSAKGTLMTPKFFLTGAKLELGTKDRDRRGQLARWITKNPWFAKSQVNRIWSELVGQGFYDQIDDLGPDRECANPEALEFLAEKFAENDFDMKWLTKTILMTSVYQKKTGIEGSASTLATSQSQRLRADQLYNCVASALDLPVATPNRRGRAQPYSGQRGARGAFNQAFGYDPSNPRDEVTGSIPQALSLMNSRQINSQINGRNRKTMLGKLIRETDDPVEITQELYLRVLAREPKAEELEKCVTYIRRRKNKIEGFEDVLWALLNSAELLHRH